MSSDATFKAVQPRIQVITTESLGFVDLDPKRALGANPQLLRKVLPVLGLIQARWPKVQSPKYIQAMHGEMAGFFEIRIQLAKENHRIFFRPLMIDSQTLVIIAATSKLRKSGLAASTYEQVRLIWKSFLEHPEKSALLETISIALDPGL